MCPRIPNIGSCLDASQAVLRSDNLLATERSAIDAIPDPRHGAVQWAARLSVALLTAVAGAAASQTMPASGMAGVPDRVDVERVVVEGATLIAPQTLLAGATLPHGPTPLAALQRLAEQVQRRYAQAGFGGVVAYLPPQGVVGGVVRIVVVEGKLSTIAVRGVEGPAGDAARAALPDLEHGRTPQLRRLDRELQIANENPSRHLQLLLYPGDSRGDISAEISVQQRDPVRVVLSAENTGNEGTGRWRVGATLQHADLSGVGDVATLQLQTSPTRASKVVVASALYRRPLPEALMMVEGYAAYSNIDAGASATAVGDVMISGRGQLAGLRATRFLPLATDLDQRVAVALDRRAYLNRCSVANLPPAACGGVAGDVTVMPVTLEYALRAPGATGWAASIGWMRNFGWGGHGADAASFAALRPGATPRFGAWRIATSAQTMLADAWPLRARLNLQWTDDALVSGEQFGIGGVSSVRGYREREVTGDRGAAATVELATPGLLTDPAAGTLRAFAFLDEGLVSNRLGAPCRLSLTRCELAGAGLGLEFDRGGLSMRLAAARALRDGVQTARGDVRLHAAAQYAF